MAGSSPLSRKPKTGRPLKTARKSVVDWSHAIWLLADAKTGWSRWPEGEAREWEWDAEIGVAGAKPAGEKWERGFEVLIQLLDGDTPTTDLLVYNATGVGAKLGFQALYAEYEELAADNRQGSGRQIASDDGRGLQARASRRQVADNPARFRSSKTPA